MNELNLVDRILFYIIDSFNRQASHTNPAHVHDNIEVFLEKQSAMFTDLLPQDCVGVDIGAGKGIMSKVLWPRITKNLDIDPPSDGYEPKVKGRAEELPFQSDEMDYALFLYSLHHFSDPVKAIEEAHRVIKPGGYLIAMVEFIRFRGQQRLIHLNEISMERIIYGRQDYSNHPETYFPVNEFERIIQDTGFNVQRKKVYKPTRMVDVLFKTKKILYVMQRPAIS